MPVQLTADAPPLRSDTSGALRVGESRVLLEIVIRAHQDGATPETIVKRYSTLQLADVYAVIAYYLNHRDQIERYLEQREAAASEVREKVEVSQGDLTEMRERLNSQRNA